MKKYIVLKAFATNLDRLCINGDTLYGNEGILSLSHVSAIGCPHGLILYDAKTREKIGFFEAENVGKLDEEKVSEYLKELK